MSAPFALDPEDAAPTERGERLLQAMARFDGRHVADPTSVAFEEAYSALWSYFGDKNEMERREVIEGWLREPLRQGAISIDYHLLAWHERSSGALAAVRDCFVGVDTDKRRCVVFLSHSLVLPSFRRSGAARLVRTAPASLGRQQLALAGLDPRNTPTVLVAEMEPVVPQDLASIVRMLSYGRAGFGVVPPSALPYCQPDFRLLSSAEEAMPIPMPCVVRVLDREEEHALPVPLADAMIEHLALLHSRACEPTHVAALAEADRQRLASWPEPSIPLIVLPTRPDEIERLEPLLRSRVLLHYPERFRTALPDPHDDLRALREAAHSLSGALGGSPRGHFRRALPEACMNRIRAYHDLRYEADIGQHIMPIRKFRLVREAIEREALPIDILSPEPVSDEDLLRVHTREYLEAVRTGEPRALAQSQKFPWSPELAEAVRWTNGGTVQALRAALEDGVAANLASGFHHAHADHGEGFCTFNGLVVAFERARAEHRLQRALVLDMDLHYGNGTASLLTSRPELFQLSIYGNWYKQNQAYRRVDEERAPDTENAWSVPVPNGADGAQYLEILRSHLDPAIDRARPDALLFQAGADPYREDPYSPLLLDHADLKARDALVFETCKRRGLPVLWVLAGGYTQDVSKVVEVHLNTARAACAVYLGMPSMGV